MTNPAVSHASDGPSSPAVDPDLSFLADFESTVMGKETDFSDEPERSSAAEPDAADVETADQPAVEASPAKPSDPAAPASPDADSPKYEPLSYTVNGQSKVADWVLRVGDEGAVVPQEHIGKLQDLIQRDEWQNAQNRELYAKTQQYESLTYKSNDQEYRGVQAFRQLEADKAMLDAGGSKALSALADPEFVTNLALAYQAQDQGQVQNLIGRLIQEAKREGEYAQFRTLRDISQRETQATTQQSMAQAQDTEYKQIIGQFAQALPDLTPDDLQAMHDQFSAFRDRIFRSATMQEAQQLGVRVGTVIKDPTVMHQWALDRASLRKQYTAATSAAQKAAQENAARQAAPRPTKGKPARQTSPSAPAASKEARFKGDDGSYAAWKREMQAGRYTGTQQDDT